MNTINILNGVTLASHDEVTEHAGNTTVHLTEEERTSWNSKADASQLDNKADANMLTAHETNTTVHVSQKEKEKWNARTTKGVVAATQDGLDEHVENTTVHVTEKERTTWNAKVDSSELGSKVNTDTFNTHQNNATVHITDAERKKWNATAPTNLAVLDGKNVFTGNNVHGGIETFNGSVSFNNNLMLNGIDLVKWLAEIAMTEVFAHPASYHQSPLIVGEKFAGGILKSDAFRTESNVLGYTLSKIEANLNRYDRAEMTLEFRDPSRPAAILMLNYVSYGCAGVSAATPSNLHVKGFGATLMMNFPFSPEFLTEATSLTYEAFFSPDTVLSIPDGRFVLAVSDREVEGNSVSLHLFRSGSHEIIKGDGYDYTVRIVLIISRYLKGHVYLFAWGGGDSDPWGKKKIYDFELSDPHEIRHGYIVWNPTGENKTSATVPIGVISDTGVAMYARTGIFDKW